MYSELLKSGKCDERMLIQLFLLVEKLRGEVCTSIQTASSVSNVVKDGPLSCRTCCDNVCGLVIQAGFIIGALDCMPTAQL